MYKLNKLKILAIQIFNIQSFRTSVQIVQTEQTLNTTLSQILNIQRCKTNEQTVQTEQTLNTIVQVEFRFLKLQNKCTNCTNCKYCCLARFQILKDNTASEQTVQTEQIQNIGNLDFKFWDKCTNCTN